jgi:hypothetical protein
MNWIVTGAPWNSRPRETEALSGSYLEAFLKRRVWPAATYATLKVICVRMRRGSLIIAIGGVQDGGYQPAQ